MLSFMLYMFHHNFFKCYFSGTVFKKNKTRVSKDSSPAQEEGSRAGGPSCAREGGQGNSCPRSTFTVPERARLSHGKIGRSGLTCKQRNTGWLSPISQHQHSPCTDPQKQDNMESQQRDRGHPHGQGTRPQSCWGCF